MCSRMKFNGKLVSPGQQVVVHSPDKKGEGKWAGFARSETLQSKWEGWVPVDIPADEYAEHNRSESREQGVQVLTWAETGDNKVISGIGNRKTGQVRIVTREATEEEVETFGHNRMPLVVKRRYA